METALTTWTGNFPKRFPRAWNIISLNPPMPLGRHSSTHTSPPHHWSVLQSSEASMCRWALEEKKTDTRTIFRSLDWKSTGAAVGMPFFLINVLKEWNASSLTESASPLSAAVGTPCPCTKAVTQQQLRGTRTIPQGPLAGQKRSSSTFLTAAAEGAFASVYRNKQASCQDGRSLRTLRPPRH